MTNPGNAVGTNGAFGGRTSVNALNDVLSAFSGSGILSGWAAVPKGGLTVGLGGIPGTRDVAIALDDNGNKTTINNISESPVEVTLPAVPSVGQRIDLIVAYVNNPPQGISTEMDNPGACGLIVVSGSPAASSPIAPTESNIRSAITADGASGTTAYYCILAQVIVSAEMTDVVDSNITSNVLEPFRKGPGVGMFTDTGVNNIGISTKVLNQSVKALPHSGAVGIGLAKCSFATTVTEPCLVDVTVREGTVQTGALLGSVTGEVPYLGQYVQNSDIICPFQIEKTTKDILITANTRSATQKVDCASVIVYTIQP